MPRLGTVSGILPFLVLCSVVFCEAQKLKQSDYQKVKEVLDHNPKALFKFDPDISYMFKPNFEGIRHGSSILVHKTNSRSLLGSKEINPEPGTVKILFLGDSVAYGDAIPYQKTVVYRMQQLAPPKKYHLANGSCPGWSTHQEIAFYDKYLSDIDWKAIVIMFCVNDLIKFEWVYDSDTKFKLSAEMENIGGLAGLTRARESLRLWNMRRRFLSDPRTKPLASYNNTCLFAWVHGRWVKLFEDVLLEFAKRKDRPMVIFVFMPTMWQIEALGSGVPSELALYPQNQLKSFCNSFGIPFIDPRQALSTKGIPLDRIFKDHLHLSEEGHEIMAHYLWPRLKDLSGERE